MSIARSLAMVLLAALTFIAHGWVFPTLVGLVLVLQVSLLNDRRRNAHRR